MRTTKTLILFAGLLSLAAFGLSACGDDGGGTSISVCSSDDDCAEGEACRSGACKPTCSSDDDCASGESCTLGNICVTTCQAEGECGSGESCRQPEGEGEGESEAPGFCWPEGRDLSTCRGGNDAECGADEYCAGRGCIPNGCEEDSDCIGNNICDEAGGFCRSGCRDSSDCADNEMCSEANSCVVAGCSGPTINCGDHETCNEDVSPSQCEFTGSCDSEDDDAICQAFADQQQEGEAEIPWICDVENEECIPRPPCEGDEDCESDEICQIVSDDRNTCVEGCNCTDGCERDCSTGEVCQNRQCQQGCQTDADCSTDPDGDVCVDNVCRVSCESRSDCEDLSADGLVCRTAAGGEERICQECARDGDCQATEECRADLGESADDETGLCRPLPPECPTDGYGDNHAQEDAFEIMSSQFPFEATASSSRDRPTICRSPSSNPNYDGMDGDWWKFQAAQGGASEVIDITVEYDPESVGNVDIALVNSAGDQLVSSIRPPGEDGGKERIVFGPSSAGTFFLKVTQALQRGVTSAEYDLTIDVRPPMSCGMDGKEENDTRQNAQPFQPDTKGNFTVCGDDKDFYTLDAKANQNVTVTATGVPERLGDIALRLVDPKANETTLVRQDQGGTMELNYSTEDASKLVLEVRIEGGAPGFVDYGLEWTQSPNVCNDMFEPNDTCPTTAYQLQRPTSSTSSFSGLAVCNDDDFYAIDLFPRDDITVTSEFDRTDGTIEMTLFGPDDCVTLAQSASQETLQGSKRELKIDYSVPATGGGTYHLQISKVGGPNNVPHDLTVDVTPGPQCTDDDLEPNDSSSNATSLSRSSITQGGEDSFFLQKKICDNNEDWYCVNANSGDTVSWDVEFDHGKGDLDAFIVDPTGTQVASSTSNTDDENVSFTTQQSGDHCLKVQGDGPKRNNYDVFSKVNGQPSTSCPDIYEENDSCASSSNCSAATPMIGSTDKLLSCSGDVDWYETSVKAGETLDVDLTFKHNDGDIDLEIFEEDDVASRTIVPGTDGTTSNNDESVSVTSSKDQSYFYRVTLNSGQRNDYDMTVSKSGPPACNDDTDEPNNSSGNATPVDAPGQRVNRFKCENDEDWYEFDLNSGQKFEAFVNHDSDLGDIDIEVFEKGSLGSPVSSGTSTDDDESVTLSSPSSGTHFVRVFTKGNSRVPYDLLLFQDLDGDGDFSESNEGPEDRQCPDVFENNDSRSNSARVAADTFNNLLMCVPDPATGPDEDWYEIFVQKEAEIVADATFKHADGDINMELFRDTGSSVKSVDTSNSTTDNESVSENFTQNGATYFIKVTGSTSSSQGFRNGYDLTVNKNFINASCSEDTFGSSGSGNFNQSDAASITAKDFDMSDSLTLCENKDDWFSFTPSSNGSAKFGLSHTSRIGEITLEIRNSSGTILGTTTSSFGGNIKVAEASGLSSGTKYFVRVYPTQNRTIRNDYDLWASWPGGTPSEPWCPDVYERNDVQGDADSASISFTDGRSQHGTAIACGSEEDWYKVDLQSSNTYNLDAFFDHDTDSDLAIELRDSSGSVVTDTNGSNIDFSTNDSSNNDEQTDFSPGSNGTFFFGINNQKSGETTNPFQIIEDSEYVSGTSGASTCQSNFDDVFEQNDSSTSATDLNVASQTSGDLPVTVEATACDKDNYTWSPNSNGTVDATLYMDNSNVNLGLEIKEVGSNTTVVSDTGIVNPTNDNRASGTFVADSTKTYIITITRGNISGSLSNGPYILRLE